MDPQVAPAQIASVSMDAIPKGFAVITNYCDAGADCIAIILHTRQFHLKPFVAGCALVEQQPGGPVIIGNQHIKITIVVDIANGCAAADPRHLKSHTGSRGCFSERFSAFIVKELIALIERIWLTAQCWQQGYCAVCNEQIEPPVVIIINPSDAEPGREER